MNQYASQPVLFLEYDTDDSAFNWREWRWWAAFEGSSVILPTVMVDSGNEISNGYVDFATVYGNMVDTSLSRPPQGTISATSSRVGNTLEFDIQVTNQSGVVLGPGNDATVWAIVYEEFGSSGTGRLTNRFVRAAAYADISQNLAHGETDNYTVATSELNGVVWDNLEWVALAEYRPAGSTGAWDMIQAFFSKSQIVITKEWNGNVDSQWHTPDNWTPSGIPGVEDQVEIADSTNDPVIGQDEASLQLLLIASGKLTIDQGPLTIQ